MKNKIITAGIDEVGRGCLAGPVVSAAVILNEDIDLKLLKDSKKINFNKRLKIANYIKTNSCYAIGISSVKEIFDINILKASLLSMKRAVKKLSKKPGLLLIDGPYAPEGLNNCKTIRKGDEKIKCISAASIIAKVYRDLLMMNLAKKFKYYSWERNFGYGTKAHIEGIKKYGVTEHHRKKFSPVHNMLTK